MPATNKPVLTKTRISLFFGLGILLASSIGAVLVRGGSETTISPLMANHFVLKDDRVLEVMKYEVTIAEWNLCHRDGLCALKLHARSDQNPEKTPATGLSFVDVSGYLIWINGRTHGDFRLPSVSEWEQISSEVMPDKPEPIFSDPDLGWASSYLLESQRSRALQEQGTFSTTRSGISDLDGSVWEWTRDCYAGLAQAETDRCPAFFVAGEHIAAMSFLVRDPARGGCAVGSPPAHLGMRLVREIRIDQAGS